MWNPFRAQTRVYLDYAGAMPVSPTALDALQKASGHYANPGALHTPGQEAHAALESARASIAKQLGAKAHELVFTSGGTEGSNLALLGWANATGQLDKAHVLVSAIEHPSVLEVAQVLAERGASVTYISPNERGVITPERVQEALQPETRFVSIGWANSEIGTVQPLADIARVIRAHEHEHGTRVLLHTDAGQVPLYRAPQVHTLGVDLMTLDGGKLSSPRGVGVLYVGKDVSLTPLLRGGGQEGGLRAGTPSVALAAGMAAALVGVHEAREAESARLNALRRRMCSLLERTPELEGLLINGTGKQQLPHIINISLPDMDNEYVTLALDTAGFAIATKSACREGEEESHVVAALVGEGERWRARNVLRISMGRETRESDVERFVRALATAVRTYRTARQAFSTA